MRKFHFISGLPRSGSTLLAALLRQNPRFEAGMSGPVAGMVNTLLSEMSGRNEFSVFIDDPKRRRILQGVVENYYDDTDKQVVFDTNRAWCANMKVVDDLFPDAKVIACVRDMPWIVDSIERLVLRNAFQPSAIFNFSSEGTVYTRTEGLAKGDGMVGYAYNALKEAFFGPFARKLMLVKYESLVSTPGDVLDEIYDFIGEPAHPHHFDHVAFDAETFDERAGTPGLHTVRPKIGAIDRETVLPPDIFNRFKNDAFWHDPDVNIGGVRIV